MIGAGNRFAAALAVGRPDNWFASKMPPLLAVAYLAILRFGTATVEVPRLLAASLVSIACVATYGHLVNDVFDLEADRRAGKINRLARMRPPHRALLTATFLAAGFLPSLLVAYSLPVLCLLALNYLWPTIYSVPGTRLKERGVAGLVCDALGSHVTPALFMLALFAGASPSGAPDGRAIFAAAVALWAGALGLKGILHHQLADRASDRRAGIATFATRSSVEVIQRFMTRFNLLVELPASALLTAVVFPWCPAALVAWAVYTGCEAAKYRLGFRFAFAPAPAPLRASVPFANEMFYVLWMPIAAALQLAIDHPIMFWIPVLQAAVFPGLCAQQAGDWRAIALNARAARLTGHARAGAAPIQTGVPTGPRRGRA
jgi:4-hydroxybenzoate polyprenyltransferase